MGWKILIVDDDKKTVDLIQLSLKKEDFETLEAYDGLEALALTRSEAPDLIILDWLLPHISGLDLCRIIRSESTIPVIMLTAKATEEDKLLGLNLDVDDYLTKPFSLRELVARVRIVLRRTHQSAERPATLRAGDLLIDLQAHEVWLSGQPIRLTPKEFKLLETFAPLLAEPFVVKNWWSGSTAWTTMVLTAPSTFTWETCVRRSRPILNIPPSSKPCMASVISSGGWVMLSSFYPRLILILHSLRLRLTLMFMLVVMVAVGTVALIANQATTNNLQVYNQAKDNQQIISTLLAAYHQRQSQQALQALTEQLARNSHQRLVLLDQQNRVIADSDYTLIGQVITSPVSSSPSTTSSSHSDLLYISTDVPAQSSAHVDFQLSNNSPEATFLTSVNHALWMAVLIAGLLALLLALGFSSTLLKPLHTLKAAAGRMEQGDLSQRVPITAKGEIGALAHAFNTMADSLSRSEQARRNLMNDVAHELRNPLMNIRGALELLADQILEPTQETLASLYEETSLLSRLVSDLQDLSLAEAGQLRLARQPIELAEVVSQTVQIVQPQLERKHLMLRVSLPSHLPPIEADPERVAQILRNLLSNAIMHTSPPGEISITASLSAAMVQIRVQDTGEGIAPEHLPYLFDRFYRADVSRSRATGGAGLGLAIVKQMIQAHGGQITVESQPGKGTCFTFSLPAVPSTPSHQGSSPVAVISTK